MNDFYKQLKKPVFGLAPMDGVTDYPTREIQTLISKSDLMYTEFISVEGFVRNPKAFEKKLFFKDNQRPIIAQLFGYTPEFFSEVIVNISLKNFDGIDINMGCPAKSVLQKGGGGALIGNFVLAEKIINFSLKAIKKTKKDIPLSVKTRVGKEKVMTKEWVNFLSEFPLKAVALHGRILKQGNSGEVLWNEIAKASHMLKNKEIVCLGNGGIKSLKEAKEKCTEYDLDGILIGQAACGNPWIFADRQPTQKEILETIKKHAQLVSSFYEPKAYVTILKHFSWYPKEFPNSKKLKIELLKTRNYQETLRVITQFEKASEMK